MAWASGAAPVFTDTYPPACWIRSNELRSTIRSLTTGNAFARHGSIRMRSPLRNSRMWSWHTVVRERGPWGLPSIVRLHEPQMPSRQSCSKTTGSSPFSTSCSFRTSSISRKDMCSFAITS